jgi:hypothetical protein
MVRRSCSSDGHSLDAQTPSEPVRIADQMIEAATAAIADPPAEAEADSAGYRAPMPFAWQSGRQLILVDEDPDGFWVMAELLFNPDHIRYVELRRASYLWFREALGAAMSRALTSGENASADLAENLSAWFDTHHASALAAEAR